MKKLVVLLFLLPAWVQAQVLTDTGLQQTVLKALDNIYNFDFAQANVYINQINARYPQSPVAPTLRSLALQWQYYPIKDYKAVTAQFVQANDQTIALAGKMLERDKTDSEGIFFALTGHGYMALKYTNDNQPMKALGESKKAYTYIMDAFDLVDKNPEFYFTTGLYNYYVERYPDDHAIVRPLMWFFKDGDIALGLKQMDIAVKRAPFSRTEAAYYLTYIYLKHESQPNRAVAYSKFLTDKYPNNPIYLLRHAEGLLLAGRYDEAQPFVQRMKQTNHKLLPMVTQVFEGILAEKAQKEDKAASSYYQNALKLPFNDPYTKEYHAMAYAGLARIAARSSDRSAAKNYYKKALDIGEYKSLIAEAKAYLKS